MRRSSGRDIAIRSSDFVVDQPVGVQPIEGLGGCTQDVDGLAVVELERVDEIERRVEVDGVVVVLDGFHLQ